MNLKRKLRVAVLYGGRSGEHEVSLMSAASVLKNLDRSRFEVIPVGISKEGKWHLGAQEIPNFENTREITQAAFPEKTPQWDVIFPVVHGPMCEDGTLQGLLELTEIPYVGSSVIGSAIGMDKDVAKRLAHEAKVKVTPYRVMKFRDSWKSDLKKLEKDVSQNFGYPLFVKPCNMGSSVGIHKVKEASALELAVSDAFQYDRKILIEKGLDAREIELSVLESLDNNSEPIVSIAGEIVPSREFYSYEAKYFDSEDQGSKLLIPAPIPKEKLVEAQNIARTLFRALECEGMARVDLFLEKKSGEFYFNEVNTIPGFTKISMYPKMLEASGIPYSQLLTHLIELALKRQDEKSRLKRG